MLSYILVVASVSILRVLAIPFSVLHAHAIPTSRTSAATVQLDNATFVGVANGSIDYWYGIPFAEPVYGFRSFSSCPC